MEKQNTKLNSKENKGSNRSLNSSTTQVNSNNNKKKFNNNYLNFKNYPLEKEIFFDVEEDKSIEELRKIKKEEWKKKEEEVKVKQKVEGEKKEKESESFKKLKEFERKNVTTDSNGNIIFIKGTAIDKLNSDFLNTKSEVKEKGEIANVVNMKNDKNDNQANRDRNKERELLLEKSKKGGEKPAKANKKIEFSGGNIPMMNMGGERHDKPAITPAGSSFNFIMPEIGVTVIEGGQSKFGGGGRDYFKAFKKYSKYDYQTMLRDSGSSYFTASMNINIDNVSSNNNTTDKNVSLPKIGGGGGNIYKIPDYNVTTNQQMNSGLINFKTKYGASLKSALDGLDQIMEFDENAYDLEDKLKTNNLFRRTFKNDTEKLEGGAHTLEEINKFNLSIVNNAQWGTNLSKGLPEKHDNQTHFKPDLKEIQREVGINIAKTKLPRSRVYSYVKTPANMMSATASSSFGAKKAKTGKNLKETKTSNFNQTVNPDKKFSQTATNNVMK